MSLDQDLSNALSGGSPVGVNRQNARNISQKPNQYFTQQNSKHHGEQSLGKSDI